MAGFDALAVVAVGVDTLTWKSPVQVRPAIAKRLQELQDDAKTKPTPPLVHLCGGRLGGGATLSVLPHGVKRYRWGLESKDLGIRLWFTDSEKIANVKCELGSFALWHLGAQGAYEFSRDLVAEFIEDRSKWPAKPSRCDLTVDFQGPEFTPTMALECVTRAHDLVDRSHVYGECAWCDRPYVTADASFCAFCGFPRGETVERTGRHGAPVVASSERDPVRRARVPEGPLRRASFSRRRKFTGWQWGSSGAVVVRLYNKSLEIKQNSPDKVWFREVWNMADGYDPAAAVWRLELELKGDFLRGWAPGGVRPVETVEELIASAESLWRYVVGASQRSCKACGAVPIGKAQRWRSCRPCLEAFELEHGRKADRSELAAFTVRRARGWLEVRDSAGQHDEAPARWPVHALWRRMQEIPFTFSNPAAEGARRVRATASVDVNRAMATGCASTIATVLNLPERFMGERGRMPSPEELQAAALVEVVANIDPMEFWSAVDRKRRKLGIPSFLPSIGSGESSPAPLSRAAERAPERRYREVPF